MPKLVSSRLQRFLACALPMCALSLLAQRLVLAQRPSNALPPPAASSAPTDEYYRGESPYPTSTPSTTPIPTPTQGGSNPYAFDPGGGPGTPQPQATVTPTPTPQGEPQAYGTRQASNSEDGGLEGFLNGETGPLKLSQARGGWRSMRIVREGRAPAPLGNAASPSNTDKTWTSMLERFAGAPNVFLTRGRTIKLNGDDQLLVYQAQFPTSEQSQKWFETHYPQFRGSGSQHPGADEYVAAIHAFLNTIPLRASLVNTRHITAMEAIEPFDFQTRFNTLSREVSAAIQHLNDSNSGQAGTPRNVPGSSEGSSPGSSTITPPYQIPSRPRDWANGSSANGSGGSPRTPDEAPRVVPLPEAVAQAAASEPLRRLFSAVQRYRADHNDMLPPLEDLAQAQAALSSYLSGSDSWRDPVSGRFFLPNARLSGRRMVHLKPFASSLILFYSEPDTKGQRSVMRLDGIVRRVSPTEWVKLTGTAGVQ